MTQIPDPSQFFPQIKSPFWPSGQLPAAGALPDAGVLPEHLAKRLQLLQTWTARPLAAGAESAKLLAQAADPSVWRDLLSMQQATMEQLNDWMAAWQTGLTELGQQCLQLKAANTMSKLVEQDMNLVGQFGDLVRQQSTALVTLLESIQVGYAYWVSEQR